MRCFFIFCIITIISNVFSPVIFAQSIFSGLILTEKKKGLKVIDVQSGSPVYKAGLKPGDFVLEIDGKKLRSLEDYVRISRDAKRKKLEASLTILRDGINYEAIIKIYSVPIFNNWNEKVTGPVKLPGDLKVSPYKYWVGKANRSLKKYDGTASVKIRITSYNKSIKYFYYGLHYQPKSIDTVLQIAKSHHELGNLYLKDGKTNDGISNFKISFRLYVNCLKKTQKEEHLEFILKNLKEIEKGLSEIGLDKTKQTS